MQESWKNVSDYFWELIYTGMNKTMAELSYWETCISYRVAIHLPVLKSGYMKNRQESMGSQQILAI